MDKELYVTDESGNIIDVIDREDKYVKLSDGDKVVRKGALQYLSDTVDIKYHFIKINPKIYDFYCRKYSILSTLTCHIGYMDNILSYKNGKIIKIKDLPKICGVSESTIKRQLKGLVADDIIHKIKYKNKKCLMMNPYLCCIGKRIYLSTYNEFKLSALRSEIDI